jgi:hypothetical protein
MKPITQVGKLNFVADGSSPIWAAITDAFIEIKKELLGFPFAKVDLVIVSDMDSGSSCQGSATKAIQDAQNLGWTLTCLCPTNEKRSTIQSATQINFPSNRVLEVKK